VRLATQVDPYRKLSEPSSVGLKSRALNRSFRKAEHILHDLLATRKDLQSGNAISGTSRNKLRGIQAAWKDKEWDRRHYRNNRFDVFEDRKTMTNYTSVSLKFGMSGRRHNKTAHDRSIFPGA